MIFSKKTWKLGDSINKDELNRIESGIYEALLKLNGLNLNLSFQAGRVSLTSANNYQGESNGIHKYERVVEFPQPFERKPYVIVSAETSIPLDVSASVKSSATTTKSQMTIVLQRKTKVESTSVSWIALAPTEG